MLPCQNSCSQYCAGCHKTCEAWKDFLLEQKDILARKKDFLRLHNDTCSVIIRQCRSMTPSRPITAKKIPLRKPPKGFRRGFLLPLQFSLPGGLVRPFQQSGQGDN